MSQGNQAIIIECLSYWDSGADTMAETRAHSGKRGIGLPALNRSSDDAEVGPRQRLGIVDLDFGFSGITRYILALLRGLDRREFEVVLFCRPEPHYRDLDGVHVVYVTDDSTRTEGNGTASTARKATVPISPRGAARWLWHRLSPRPVKDIAGFLRDARWLAKLIRAESIDLLNVQIVGDAEGTVAGRLARVPRIVGTYHMNPRDGSKHRRLPEILTTRCLAHAIFVSQSTKDEWCRRRRFDAGRVSVIPNGVDVRPDPRCGDRDRARHQLGLPSGSDPVIVSLGRLAEQKGYRYLLEAAASLISQFPLLQVVLAGDGPLRPQLEAQANQLGMGHHVQFMGHRSDVQSVLDAGDVFVLPSLWEAMPFAVLEAMACGIPVVATRVAGIPELVEPGITGMLAPPANGAALADSIQALLTMPDRGGGLAAAARARIEERYSLRAMLAQTSRLYRQLLQSPCPREAYPKDAAS
jgi:glycosyltransferase involved in cell wall biosynthesis